MTSVSWFYVRYLCLVKSSETENHINSEAEQEKILTKMTGGFLNRLGSALAKSPQGSLQAPNLGVHSGANPPSLDFWMFF